MNCISFTDRPSFDIAINTLVMEATPVYQVDSANLTIWAVEIRTIASLLNDNGIFKFDRSWNDEDYREDNFRTDAEADADALASAGFGTDEDYGGDRDGGYDE